MPSADLPFGIGPKRTHEAQQTAGPFNDGRRAANNPAQLRLGGIVYTGKLRMLQPRPAVAA
jgi:hypothetical protein